MRRRDWIMKNEKEIKELEKEYQAALERNRRAKEILNDLPDDDDEDI